MPIGSVSPYYPILKSIITVNQADDFKAQVEEIKSYLYRKPLNPENILEKFLPAPVFENLQSYCQREKISLEKAVAVEKLLSDLQQEVLNAQILRFEVAFEPTQKTVDLVSDWMGRHATGQKILLSFTVNRSLIASTRIFFRGKMWDYSLKAKLQQSNLTVHG